MALQGEIATLPVRELLGMLARTRASGRLSLSRGMTARRFHLREGRVMLASSSEEQNLLGRLLVDRGLLTADELERALATRGPARPKVRARLGKMLAEAGLVTPAQVAGVLAEKIERLLVDAMTWSDGQFYFDDEATSRLQGAVSTAVDLYRLLRGLGGGRSANDADRTVPITDADVLEVRALCAQDDASASGPAPQHPSTESRTRRRKRGAAVA